MRHDGFVMRLPRPKPTPAPEDAPGGVAVHVRGLRHTYDNGARATPVLHGLDLDVPAGGYLALTGPSGAGKSTLLALIGGLEPPQEGEIAVGEHDLRRLGGDELAAYRRRT